MLFKLQISVLFLLLVLFSGLYSARLGGRRRHLRERCPRVKALRNFNIHEMMGHWHVVQYFASSEEMPEYACMRSFFTLSEEMQITSNFTYLFAEDPVREQQFGNITWFIPNVGAPAHWMHTEYIYEGVVYNTYVIDTDYKTWALIMHCAEKHKSPKYLSALLLARDSKLPLNAVNFLREKLPRYDIDVSFMFDIDQSNCDARNHTIPSVKYEVD